MRTQTIALTEWLKLIQAEYREVPGLHLTKPQIQRMWGIDAGFCEALVAALIDVRFLRPTARHGFIRADA